MQLSEGVSLVCAEMCLQVHQVLPKMTRGVKIAPGKVGGCATWLTKGGHFFTLIKSGGCTLAYCHANGTLYFASPDFSLGRDCPDHHAFLGQTVMDQDNRGGLIPRLLIMDLVHPQIACPLQRGNVLRSLAHHLPTTCSLQWNGELSCLKAFLEKGLPHESDGVVGLGSDPLRLVRDMQIQPIAQAVLDLLPENSGFINSHNKRQRV
jgi:hypothetical protein